MRYGLGMTAPTAKRARWTTLVRVAGVLLVISALAAIAKDAIGQYLDYRVFSGLGDTDPEYALLGPVLLTIAVEAVALFVGFVLLSAWFASPLPSAAFLLLALGIPAGYLLQMYARVEPALDIVHGAVAIFAGIVVLVQGLFEQGVRIIFLIVMLLFALQLVAGITGLLFADLWQQPVASYILSAAYLVFGVALVVRYRSAAPAPAAEAQA
ncbi:MAG: hypothetical protein QOD50_1726 [Actinomycetota bacterium]|nr:hypothetical protein [Actinomycetota bacterium]